MQDYVDVESSNLDAVKHDPETDTLFVVFVGGAHYRYDGVGKALFDGLVGAESVGRFFHREIRSNFPCVRIEGGG